jgi:hypothetical protein
MGWRTGSGLAGYLFAPNAPPMVCGGSMEARGRNSGGHPDKEWQAGFLSKSKRTGNRSQAQGAWS